MSDDARAYYSKMFRSRNLMHGLDTTPVDHAVELLCEDYGAYRDKEKAIEAFTEFGVDGRVDCEAFISACFKLGADVETPLTVT